MSQALEGKCVLVVRRFELAHYLQFTLLAV